MTARLTRTAAGRIVSFQEDRIRLITDDGRALLLTVGRSARVSVEDLTRWRDAQARVQVTFSGEPNLLSGAALAITPEA